VAADRIAPEAEPLATRRAAAVEDVSIAEPATALTINTPLADPDATILARAAPMEVTEAEAVRVDPMDATLPPR